MAAAKKKTYNAKSVSSTARIAKKGAERREPKVVKAKIRLATARDVSKGPRTGLRLATKSEIARSKKK